MLNSKCIIMIEPQIKESESFEHLRIKNFFYENIPLDNDIDVIIKEFPIGNRKADLYCELYNGKKIVIEILSTMIFINMNLPLHSFNLNWSIIRCKIYLTL